MVDELELELDEDRVLVESVLELLLWLELLVDTSVDQVEVEKDGAKVELQLLLGGVKVEDVEAAEEETLLLEVGSVCECSPSSVHVVELEDAGAMIAVEDVDGELLDRVVATLVLGTEVVEVLELEGLVVVVAFTDVGFVLVFIVVDGFCDVEGFFVGQNGGNGGGVGLVLCTELVVVFGFVEVVFLVIVVAFFVLVLEWDEGLLLDMLLELELELELRLGAELVLTVLDVLDVLDVLVGTDPDEEDVDNTLEVDVDCVALAVTVGTLVDTVREALVCGRSSPQSQGSVPWWT